MRKSVTHSAISLVIHAGLVYVMLEKLELARRVRSGEDRRVIYVAVTSKYQSLRERAEADVGGYFASVLSTMTAEDRDMVARALLRLDEALLAKEHDGETLEEEAL